MLLRKTKVFHIDDSNCQRITKANLRNYSKKRKFPRKCIAMKVLKTIIFIISLLFFIYQSTRYLTEYYKYPTTTKLTKEIKPKTFKMPCITFCNTNQLKRSKFCREFSHLCEPPNNLTAFCSQHPHMCSGNISKLLIPKFGHYSSDATVEVFNAVKSLYENRNMSQEARRHWTWDIIPRGYNRSKWEMTASLGQQIWILGHPACYSANLRFSNQLEAETWPVNEFDRRVEHFELKVDETESLFPWKVPHVFVAVHSPFIPIHPLREGKELEIGFGYHITVRVEEERLLPDPYQTDCTDYDALWRRNNKTGPRSQEVCRQWCYLTNDTSCDEFHPKALMIQYEENMCELVPQNHFGFECMKDCKADCINLRYFYKTLGMPLELRTKVKKRSRRIYVYFYVEDSQALIMSHIPLYDSGDLFSYIGGLMGCWLGISVATFAGILENTFYNMVHMTSKLRRYLK